MSMAAARPELGEIFKWFHRHPELSLNETNTTARLRELLTQAGIEILPLSLPTGLIAVVRGRADGPTVALRCDIDALPIQEETSLAYKSQSTGCMHACGHDFHMTSVLGAAYALKEQEKSLAGTVLLLFQPAEEVSRGAEQVIETGALDGVSAIFGLHVMPGLPVGSIGLIPGNGTAAVDRFAIDVQGVGCHAAHPELGIDPVVVSSQLVLALQTIISRQVDPIDQALISVTKLTAGNTWNVIPAQAQLEGTVRTLKPATRAFIEQRMREVCQNLGPALGAQIKLHWTAGPPSTDNDPAWVEFTKEVTAAQGLTPVAIPPALIGEDFAYYQQRIPGVFVSIGTGGTHPLHHPAFTADPAALPGSAALMAKLAVRALEKLSTR